MSEISGRELGCAKDRRKRGEGNQLLVAERPKKIRGVQLCVGVETHTEEMGLDICCCRKSQGFLQLWFVVWCCRAKETAGWRWQQNKINKKGAKGQHVAAVADFWFCSRKMNGKQVLRSADCRNCCKSSPVRSQTNRRSSRQITATIPLAARFTGCCANLDLEEIAAIGVHRHRGRC